MRFGLCCGPERASEALKAGFDFVEVPAALLADVGSDQLESWGREFRPEATNLFFPSGVRLFGPEATDWRPVASRTIRAAANAGVRVMVLGSGGARRTPEGWDPSDAEREFVAVAEELQKMADPFGVRIAPEPLNAEECDVWNDQGALARALAERGVGYCLDSYHLLHWWRRREPQAESPSRGFLEEQVPHAPLHVHWANFPFRSWPKAGDRAAEAIAERLSSVGYDARVSLECRIEWPADAEPALLALRGLFRRI